MNDEQQFFRRTTGKRRMQELRKRRTQTGVAESISNQRSMILINIIIEIATGIILLVGLFYLLRFFMIRRFSIDPMYYKLILFCIVIFTFGWVTYLTMKVRSDILRFRKSGAKKQLSKLSDN